MSHYLLRAPCGCEILAWDERHFVRKLTTKLQPCPLHGAAPKLLAACKQARPYITTGEVGGDADAYDALAAAIREAEGKSS